MDRRRDDRGRDPQAYKKDRYRDEHDDRDYADERPARYSSKDEAAPPRRGMGDSGPDDRQRGDARSRKAGSRIEDRLQYPDGREPAGGGRGAAERRSRPAAYDEPLTYNGSGGGGRPSRAYDGQGAAQREYNGGAGGPRGAHDDRGGDEGGEDEGGPRGRSSRGGPPPKPRRPLHDHDDRVGGDAGGADEDFRPWDDPKYSRGGRGGRGGGYSRDEDAGGSYGQGRYSEHDDRGGSGGGGAGGGWRGGRGGGGGGYGRGGYSRPGRYSGHDDRGGGEERLPQRDSEPYGGAPQRRGGGGRGGGDAFDGDGGLGRHGRDWNMHDDRCADDGGGNGAGEWDDDYGSGGRGGPMRRGGGGRGFGGRGGRGRRGDGYEHDDRGSSRYEPYGSGRGRGGHSRDRSRERSPAGRWAHDRFEADDEMRDMGRAGGGEQEHAHEQQKGRGQGQSGGLGSLGGRLRGRVERPSGDQERHQHPEGGAAANGGADGGGGGEEDVLADDFDHDAFDHDVTGMEEELLG